MANQIVSVSVSDSVGLSLMPGFHICTPAAETDLSSFFLQGKITLGEKGILVESANIIASNGIIHMIDGLLFPPSILPILPHRCDITQSKIILVRWQTLDKRRKKMAPKCVFSLTESPNFGEE